jgi:hypothetical protein
MECQKHPGSKILGLYATLYPLLARQLHCLAIWTLDHGTVGVKCP